MMRLTVLILGLFSLSACQTTGAGGCPPLIRYTAVQQKKAAQELRALPHGQVAQMIVDYGKMRDACRLGN